MPKKHQGLFKHNCKQYTYHYTCKDCKQNTYHYTCRDCKRNTYHYTCKDCKHLETTITYTKMPTKEELENTIKELELKLKTSEEKTLKAEKEANISSHVTHLREKKISKFTEDDDVDDWVRTVRHHVHKKTFTSEEEKIDFVLEHLDKKPKTEVRFRINPIKASLEDIFGILTEIYGIQESFLELQQEFYSRNQKPEETIDEYSHALMRKLVAVEKRDPSIVKDADKILQQRFAEGVNDMGLKRELKRLIREQDLPFHKLRELANRWMEEEHHKQETLSSEGIQLDSLVTLIKEQGDKIEELTATVNEQKQTLSNSYRGHFRGRRSGHRHGFGRGNYHQNQSNAPFANYWNIQYPNQHHNRGRGFFRGQHPGTTPTNSQTVAPDEAQKSDSANAPAVPHGYHRYCTYCHRWNHEEKNCWYKFGFPWNQQSTELCSQPTNESHSTHGSQC